MIFAWDDWNTDHIAKHGVTRGEAEHIVRAARPPFPRELGDDKYLVWGQGIAGRYLEVVFVYRSDDEVEYESLTFEDVIGLADEHVPVVYVIHAMELTPRMKRQYRRL